MDDKPWREYEQFNAACVGLTNDRLEGQFGILDAFAARVWREAQAATDAALDSAQRWCGEPYIPAPFGPERGCGLAKGHDGLHDFMRGIGWRSVDYNRLQAERDRLAAALRGMLATHGEPCAHPETCSGVIGSRAALADSPKEENDATH